MKKYALLILLTMQVGILYCQNFTLPTVILDSLIFETRKGRSCDSLNLLNERLIESQGVQLLNYDKTLKLAESKSETLESLVLNAKEGQRIEGMQHELIVDGLKSKIKRLWVWVVGEGGVILLMILLL